MSHDNKNNTIKRVQLLDFTNDPKNPMYPSYRLFPKNQFCMLVNSLKIKYI
jgi:hypothetical protein